MLTEGTREEQNLQRDLTFQRFPIHIILKKVTVIGKMQITENWRIRANKNDNSKRSKPERSGDGDLESLYSLLKSGSGGCLVGLFVRRGMVRSGADAAGGRRDGTGSGETAAPAAAERVGEASELKVAGPEEAELGGVRPEDGDD